MTRSTLILLTLIIAGLTFYWADSSVAGDKVRSGDAPSQAGAEPVSQAASIAPSSDRLATKNLSASSDAASVPWTKKLAVNFLYEPVQGLLKNMIFAFPFWGALIFTLGLERLVPAEPNRKIFSVSFAHDLVWFLYEPVLHALIVGTYVAVIAKFYRTHFSHLTFSGLTDSPGWMRVIIGLLLVDLCYWIQHYINHRVPFLWKLHAVHHSQRQLNFFTDFRYHPLEYIIRHTFITIPFLFLLIDPPVIAAVALLKDWYSRFYHGNIRTNLGPLRYILVTPQSHRIHHSLEPQHRDLNFGALFSIWDFLFRKQYRGYNEYPRTGIEGDVVPHEEKVSLKNLFLAPWRQMFDRVLRN